MGTSPNFLNFSITQSRLPDYQTKVKCVCYEFKEQQRITLQRDAKAQYKSYGEVEFRPNDFFGPRNTVKCSMSKGSMLLLENIKMIPATFSSYVDYIQAGLKLKFALAIDFSLGSYHEHNEEDNPYVKAIRAIGGIMENYDDDGKIPC